MRKYWAFCQISFQNAITYRGPIIIWLISNVLSLVGIIFVWLSASAGNLIGGYSRPELISYYLAGFLLNWIVNWLPFYWLHEQIKDGEIVIQTLAKPLSLFKQVFANEVGWHLVSVWFSLLTTLFLAGFFSQHLSFNFSWLKILILLPVVSLSILITFSLSLCMGMLAFWFTEIWALDSVYWMGRSLLGGQGIPISFIPLKFQLITKTSIFRFMYSFPLEIFFEKLSGIEIAQGIFLQCFWFSVLIWLYKLMWQKGRRAYTAFGH